MGTLTVLSIILCSVSLVLLIAAAIYYKLLGNRI